MEAILLGLLSCESDAHCVRDEDDIDIDTHILIYKPVSLDICINGLIIQT